MADVLDTTQQIVLSVRMRGDEQGPQTGDVVLGGNIFGDFSETESYDKNEAVIYNGAIYRSKDDVTAGEWNPEEWECLTDITMRISDFQPDHAYSKNEVIQVNGHLYRAPTDFVTGTDFDQDEWEAIDSVNTILWDFEAKSNYSQYEIIAKDGKLYRAKEQFVSGDTFDLSDWELIGDIIVEDFQTGKNYTKGNIIVSSGKLYRANQDFTSGNVWQPEYWDAVNSTGVGGFFSNTYYPVGSMIYVDGKLYVAKSDFTSKTAFDPADWEVASETKALTYNNNQLYQKYEVVYYNGALYRAKNDFTSGSTFDTNDWEILGSSTTDSFQPNTDYLKGTIIFQDGILWIAKKDFTSGATFDPSDWTPLTQTEQEAYDSWMSTGTTVNVEDLDEKFVNETNSNIYSLTSVDSATSYLEVSNTNAKARLQANSGEAILDLKDDDSETKVTDESLNLTKGSTYFDIDVDKKEVTMSSDIAASLASNIATMSTTQKGVAKSDGATTRVENDILSSYPIPDVFTSGHLYKQYELCTYKDQVYSAKDEFTATSWDASKWYPVHSTIHTYTTNASYQVGDVIQVNDQLYYANKVINSAPAARTAADWNVVQVSATNVVLNTTDNQFAKSSVLNTSINQLDQELSICVKPKDGITEYVVTTQAAGSTPPAATAGKTTICFYTE